MKKWMTITTLFGLMLLLVLFTGNTTALADSGKTLKLSAENAVITGAVSGSKIQAGQKVTLTATPNNDYSFTGWSIEGLSFTESTNNPLTFTMPDKDVTVTAHTQLVLGKVERYWSDHSATPSKSDAKITGKLTLNVSSSYLILGNSHRVSITNIRLTVVSGGVSYWKSFSLPTPTAETINGGKRFIYQFTADSIKDLKSDTGATLTISPGATYKYIWQCSIKEEACGCEGKFTIPSGNVKWDKPTFNDTWQFYAWIHYDKSIVDILEAGIFLSADRAAVVSAKYGSAAGVMSDNDIDNKNGIGQNYVENKKGFVVFYRESNFQKKDPSFKLQPGVTYYYKFYSRDTNGQIQYSEIVSRTIAGTPDKYALTLKAGSGGTITAGSNGSYAAGNVLTLTATPNKGYSFSGWTTTAGTLGNKASETTSFTMPASAATVTANFTANQYDIEFYVTNNGGEIVSNGSKTYTYGAKVQLKAVPKAGFRFIGWSSDNGGSFSSTSSAETTFTMPAGSVNVFADFAAVDYHIDLIADGNGMIAADKTVARYGDKIKLTAVPNDGYVFAGWTGKGVTISDVKAATITITMPAKDITVTAAFEAAKLKLSSATLKNTTKVYTGKALQPGVTVKAKVNGQTVTLKKDTDYTVTYKNNTNVGTATVTIKGKGAYTGKLTRSFTITAVKLASVKVVNPSLPYTGRKHTPVLTVKAKVGGKTVSLVKGTDYTATYTDNIEVGTATVTVKGKGNFTGTLTTTFKINKLKMSAATVTLSKTTMTYTGKALKPKVTVKAKIDGKTVTLVQGTDYTVKYTDNKAVGTATVTITGKGHFTGKVTKTFKIVKK